MKSIQPVLCCLASLIAVSGCGSSPRAATGESRGVVCPECEIVWVETYDMNDPYMMTLVSEEAMRCPDCESAVERFFRTGELRHHCSTCEGTLWYCE